MYLQSWQRVPSMRSAKVCAQAGKAHQPKENAHQGYGFLGWGWQPGVVLGTYFQAVAVTSQMSTCSSAWEYC